MRSNALRLGCVIGALFLAGQALAYNNNAMTISGASFVDRFNTGTRCAEPWNGGLSNSCDTTQFMYGIPKGPLTSTTQGYKVTFAGSHSSTATTDCTVFSYSADGNYLAYFTNLANNVNGKWTRSVTFTTTQAPTSGRLTAIVGLAGYYVGSLYGLTVAY